MAKFIEIHYQKPYANGNISRQCTYLGRNGNGKQNGIEVHLSVDEGQRVVLHPINSKGPSDSCRLEIPKEDIPKLIDALLAVTAKPSIVAHPCKKHPIQTYDDCYKWLQTQIVEIGRKFRPDESFYYYFGIDGTPLFSPEEAEKLDEDLNQVFAVVGDDIDEMILKIRSTF